MMKAFKVARGKKGMFQLQEDEPVEDGDPNQAVVDFMETRIQDD
jgi:hypothetical protein